MAESTERCQVTEVGRFAAPADRLWALVADFGGIDRIMDGVESCELDGEGIGARRTIPMGRGAVVESLDALDHDAMSLTYSIVEGPLPFADYAATMTVTADGDGASVLTWTGRFRPDGVEPEKAETLASRIYVGGIAGYAKALGV